MKKRFNLMERLRVNNYGGAAMFNFISILCFLAMIIAMISTSLEGLGTTSVLSTAAVGAVLVLVFVLGHTTKKYDFWCFAQMNLLNALVIPVVFFSSGGYKSGMPLWMTLCVVSLFYLLKGKYLWISAVVATVADVACMVVAYLYPELVTNFSSEGGMFSDVLCATIVICVLLCLFLKLQNSMFEIERGINLKQQAELEEALKAKSLFLANMSHEIRTPINTIIGLNEMTLREDVSDEVRENSENIQRASKMLLSLINDVLDLSKMEAKKMEIVPVEYDSAELFNDLINTNYMRAKSKNLELQIVVAPSFPKRLYGDDSKIRQIATNFLSNAIKYTPQGSVTLSVDSEQAGEGNINMKIEVIDTGMGIRKEDLKKLFEDFRRVNEENTRGIEGTGLGLAICKQLTELMDGTLSVDSIYGKGSTFAVTIPQRVINSDPIGDFNKGTLSHSARVRYEKRFEAPDASVLVVDDNDMNLMVAKKLLRDTKIKLDLAKSGKEALECTAQREYDVILMDHLMPEMDGVEALSAIREQKNGFCKHTPVVALTANAMSGAAEQYRRYGFADYLAKPISGDMLEKVLSEQLPPDKLEYQKYDNESTEMTSVKIINRNRRKRIAIATDNTCDLPASIIKPLGMFIMYHYVQTEEGKFHDMQEIYTDNLIEYLSKGKNAKDVAPGVEEYENFFGNVLEKAETVIYVATSEKFAESFKNLSKAAESFNHVIVFDSQHLSSGLGIIAMEAAKMAIDDKPVEEILARMTELRDKVSTSFVIDSGTQLVNAGLLSKGVNRLAEHFDLHVQLEISKGRLVPTALYSGDIEDVYVKYTRRMMKKYKEIDNGNMFITYSSTRAEARERVKEEMYKYHDFSFDHMQKASASVTAYCGPGTLGVMFVHK